MVMKNYFNKAFIAGVLCMSFLVQSDQVYAYWRGEGGHGGGWRGGYGGSWRGGYGGGWGWPVAGAVVLGAAATAIWIGNRQYYYDDSNYYDYTPQGYVVVTPPVETTVTTTPQPVIAQNFALDNIITVNVPKDKGGYASVVIKISNNGFVGPQGEFYSQFPKVSQLRLMYGK